MTDICGDNRFEVIAEAKKDLLESTNIEMSPDEMSVIDNFLFRCWQIGWLRQYETFEFCNGENPCKEYDQEKHCCHRWTKVIRQTIEEMKAESEQKRTFLEIDVSYPPICTYPEYEGKPYYAIKYLEDGEIIVGFGTYKPDVLSEYLRKYFIQSADTERTVKPKKGAYDLIRCDCGMPVSSNYYYCPKCKAKLEWSDDE